MRFSTAFALALSAIVPATSGGAVLAPREVCDAARRIDIAVEAVDAILKPTALQSRQAYFDLPFSNDAQIIINPNEAGDIPVSFDRLGSINFLGVIYQIVETVTVDKYLNIDDTHSFFNVTGDLAAAHYIPVPASVFFDVFLTYTLEPCRLQEVHVYAQAPSEVMGIFIKLALGLSPTPPTPQN